MHPAWTLYVRLVRFTQRIIRTPVFPIPAWEFTRLPMLARGASILWMVIASHHRHPSVAILGIPPGTCRALRGATA